MKITVSVAQIAVRKSDPEKNLRKGDRLAAEAAGRGSDIICFPEMWTAGFDWARSARAAKERERTIGLVSGMAKRHRIWICGSMPMAGANGKPSNTSILFDPSGSKRGVYRKTHLFGAIGEDNHMAAGKSPCVVDTPWGLTGLAICYDLRFPELFRAYALKGAKIILLPAAFPYPKLDHWRTLVRARAIEDQLFMVGANRVGTETLGGSGRCSYCGSSVIVDPWGETVAEAPVAEEKLITAEIDMGRVDEVRMDMPVMKDRRPELYKTG